MSVAVKTGSKIEGYEILDDGTLKISIKERPVENKANEAVIRKIAEIYDTPKNKITIKTGLKSKNKIVAIND
ncbi:MAG: DUF167 domain-containing protein [Candidatus Acidulodesulfobacterium acidiphilum]|uniref:DUF167 domain-containing protein n=1 Tax=Candidatus Acidulodesulfobacterium acidiphilum TaxID=2597224 RepID=A0A520X5P1_9DELT|nr:MAG: DUF167 domain-containing protein [Candidatus Acidulodesulfobacterium acidiphilum]